MSNYRDKVVKLLLKSVDRSATPGEAAAYKAKAIEIAKAHGIDLSKPLTRPVPLRFRRAWSFPADYASERPARPRRRRSPGMPTLPWSRPVGTMPHPWWVNYDAETELKARSQPPPLFRPRQQPYTFRRPAAASPPDGEPSTPAARRNPAAEYREWLESR